MKVLNHSTWEPRLQKITSLTKDLEALWDRRFKACKDEDEKALEQWAQGIVISRLTKATKEYFDKLRDDISEAVKEAYE